jgi:hypothetical protein
VPRNRNEAHVQRTQSSFTLSQRCRHEAGSVIKRIWIAGLDRMDQGASGLSIAL